MGFIGTFHKNHKANIMNLCKICHNKENKKTTQKNDEQKRLRVCDSWNENKKIHLYINDKRYSSNGI